MQFTNDRVRNMFEGYIHPDAKKLFSDFINNDDIIKVLWLGMDYARIGQYDYRFLIQNEKKQLSFVDIHYLTYTPTQIQNGFEPKYVLSIPVVDSDDFMRILGILTTMNWTGFTMYGNSDLPLNIELR